MPPVTAEFCCTLLGNAFLAILVSAEEDEAKNLAKVKTRTEKRAAGHRDIRTTLIYTQLVSFEGDEYCSATAKAAEEVKRLVERGFEYVCTNRRMLCCSESENRSLNIRQGPIKPHFGHL